MKIAITHTRYSYVGGVEKYIFSLVERLLAQGHEVHYLCHFWEKDADPRIHFHRISNKYKVLRALKVLSFDRDSERLAQSLGCDLIHGFTKTSRQDIYTDGSGCLADYQDYTLGDEDSGGLVSKWLRKISWHQRAVAAIEKARFTRGHFRRIVAMSELAKGQIMRRYGLESREIEVIYNGIDLGRFHEGIKSAQRGPMREKHGFKEQDFVALLVGNDYRRKGLKTLIEAAALARSRGGLPNGQRLVIAVVGKERPAREREFRAMAKGLGDAVRFFGPQREIETWHALSDVSVLPSRFDIFGNVVLEAMALGIPAIVSSKAGAAEVIEPGSNGYVIADPKNAEAWVSALAEVAQSSAPLGAAAAESAKHYSWDLHFERILELYAAVMREKAESK